MVFLRVEVPDLLDLRAGPLGCWSGGKGAVIGKETRVDDSCILNLTEDLFSRNLWADCAGAYGDLNCDNGVTDKSSMPRGQLQYLACGLYYSRHGNQMLDLLCVALHLDQFAECFVVIHAVVASTTLKGQHDC